MIVAEYISHIRESDKKEQTVSEHSNNVAKIASEFGQAVQMSHCLVAGNFARCWKIVHGFYRIHSWEE